jgi:hypothetical protein
MTSSSMQWIMEAKCRSLLGVAAADDDLAFIKIDHAKASTTAALAEMTNRFLSVEALVEVRGTKKRNPL